MSIEFLGQDVGAGVGEAALAQADKTSSGLFGRIGSLETRLAVSQAEIEAAQRLRFSVFVEEMGARLSSSAMQERRDADAWDALCDHLLVIDSALEGDPEDQIVGTYRLLRQDVAERNGGFYSAHEFDVNSLLKRHPGKCFMELGRSCVLPEYRTRRTVELLWQGNWAYALKHNIDAMFGCASFPGDRPEAHALAFSFLHHHARARDEWAVRAVADRFVSMDMEPGEALDARRALAAMPPLVKGYLRLGAMFGEGAVVDAEFNTTDVLVILPISAISGRYVNYYGASAERFAC